MQSEIQSTDNNLRFCAFAKKAREKIAAFLAKQLTPVHLKCSSNKMNISSLVLKDLRFSANISWETDSVRNPVKIFLDLELVKTLI